MQLDRIRYTNTELKWKENVKNIGTGDLRHRLVDLEVSQLQASWLLQIGLDLYMDICGQFCDYGHFSEFFSERHLTIFDEISKLAEVIVSDGDLNKIDKMYQIRFINYEGESWWVNAKYFLQFCAANWLFILRVVDSNRKLYIAHEIRKLFGLDFTCVDVSDIIETGTGWNRIHLMMRDHKFSPKTETRKNNHNKADNVDYAGSILADIQNMQVQQENGTIFLPRFRHVFQVNMRPDRVDGLSDNSRARLGFP